MDVTMPQLGETVTEGTITRWLKRVGEQVQADEALFEVSTDKVDSEVPAPTAGTVVEIRVPEGDTAAVGTVLAVISDVPAGTVATPPAPEPAAPEPQPAALEPVPQAPVAHAATPAAPEASAPTPAAEAPAPPAGVVGGSLSSPMVRRLVADYGLDVAAIVGTGEGGRITRKDVLDAAVRGASAPSSEAAAPTHDAPPASQEPVPPAPAGPAPEEAAPAPLASPADEVPRAASDEVVPFSNLRHRIAEHMVRSQCDERARRTSIEVDYEHVAQVRAAHRDAWKRARGVFAHLPAVRGPCGM